jgi:hypothetical protein
MELGERQRDVDARQDKDPLISWCATLPPISGITLSTVSMRQLQFRPTPEATHAFPAR